jgi:beta-lactamase regulating signal transducer with metallopeptidase domain
MFYQLVLRRLTFYNSNRWYLLGYTLLCFFISFINISPFVKSGDPADNTITGFIPSIETYTGKLDSSFQQVKTPSITAWNTWDWILLAMIAGIVFLMARFLVGFLSFLRLKRKAELISDENMKLYHVNESIIPFSFGNAVFINNQSHSQAELQEIIRHEFVHVKQKHTIDILWSEILCILNWYNPFAWLLKNSIRQNLEFIADNKTLENGVDKKEYQYLLLKVIGSNHFSIAQKFNFSSLKKRIIMMNKLKTAKIHLLRFLFIVPLMAVLLISFRRDQGDTIAQTHNKTNRFITTDTLPGELNEKGYIIDVVGKKSNATVIIKDKDNKVVERIALNKWQDNESFYEDKYGQLPTPPLPPSPPSPPSLPTPPQPMELPDNVTKIEVNDKSATVILKDGKTEKYDWNKPSEKAAFEKKYGEIIPTPPMAPASPTAPTPPRKNRSVVVVETLNPVIADEVSINELNEVSVASKVNISSKTLAASNVENITSDVSSVKITENPATNSVLAGNEIPLYHEEQILLTITKKTTKEQLEAFIEQMREKGVELKYSNMNYNDGVLVSISGTIKLKDNTGRFSATDFSKLTISTIKEGDKVYFKINVSERYQRS